MKSGFSVYSLVGRYQDLGFVFWGILDAIRRCGTRFLFSLFPGCPAAGRDWDRGEGERTAQASDTTPVAGEDPERTLA